jgi:hypothetical protein
MCGARGNGTTEIVVRACWWLPRLAGQLVETDQEPSDEAQQRVVRSEVSIAELSSQPG